MEKVMSFKQILERIVKSNQSIRFAAVFDRFGSINEKIHRDGASLMMDEYQTQNMLREAANFWHHRNNLSKMLGRGHYTMTVYDNLIRITIPLSDNHFMIISHDQLDDQPKLVKQILQEIDASEIESLG